MHEAPVAVSSSGSFSLSIAPDSVYTLSTTTGQRKGAATTPPNPRTPFPMPYTERFEAYPEDTLPKFASGVGVKLLLMVLPVVVVVMMG